MKKIKIKESYLKKIRMLDKIQEVGSCIVSDNSHIEQLSTCVYEMPQE